jgi:hypothetical protein
VGAYIVGYGDCKKCLDSLGSGVLHSSADFTAGIGRPQITTTGGELVLEGMVAARDFNLTRYSTGTQNFLNNASFEQMGGSKTCPDQWTCDGAGGATFGPSSSPPVVFGQRKLQIKVTPMATATLSQKVNLAGIGTTSSPQVSTSSLTASFYLRSLNITLTPAQVKVLINDAECTPLVPAKIDAQWRRFQCTIPNTATVVELKLVARGLRTGVGPYTLEVDGAQIELAAEATEWHDMFTATDTNYQASERFYYDGRVIFNTPLGFAPLSTPSWSETAAD